MSLYQLSQIYIYPVKSLPGISLNESLVQERGLLYDRRWMIVNSENVFITQRLFPQMVFVDVKIEKEKIIFHHRNKNIEPLELSLTEYPEKKTSVEIWDDKCEAVEYSKEINEWFSHALDTKCKLVYMPNTTERKTSVKYFKDSKNVSFADGYPFLIIGEEALKFLNSKLINKVSMSQFRPNLVFSGGKEHDEDKWNDITIGELKFSVGKPCARCVITTINPQDGKKNKEPLATLSKYRNFSGKVMFGQNVISHSEGIVRLGDKIELLQK
jgi:uncharacterized protein YcbX